MLNLNQHLKTRHIPHIVLTECRKRKYNIIWHWWHTIDTDPSENWEPKIMNSKIKARMRRPRTLIYSIHSFSMVIQNARLVLYKTKHVNLLQFELPPIMLFVIISSVNKRTTNIYKCSSRSRLGFIWLNWIAWSNGFVFG